MPAWLLPAALGALGVWGTAQTNRANRQMAREQMNFQERMSSTAAQRSRADYIAAGLNPALAYERTASSPGGASAIMGDAINTGASSALRAREHIQNLKIAQEQERAIREQAGAAKAANARDTAQANLNHQQLVLLRGTTPHQVSTAASEAAAAKLLLPGMRNTAELEELLGKLRPGLANARTLAEILKLFKPR